MKFINYTSDLFPNLANVEHTILSSNVHTLFVNSITFCNMSDNNIRVNLIKSLKGSDGSIIKTFIVKDKEIDSFLSKKPIIHSTVNMTSFFGLQIFLPVFTKDNINYTTELACYSNGLIQKFDCTIDYSIFNET